MAASVLVRVSRNQLDAFDEAIESAKSDIAEAWKSERHKAIVAGNLRGLLRFSQEIPNVLRHHWQSTLDLIALRLIEDYEETGQELRKAFEKALHILSRLEGLVQSFEQAGGVVEGAEALATRIEDVRRMEAGILGRWPHFTDKDMADALSELEGGECLEPAEAFAQIAGVDKETWLQRVEERKRAKQS